jgi:hypothetical protein
MIYLAASAQQSDLARIREATPGLWRHVRRYNQPVQLALAAAEEVMRFSKDPSLAAVISLAPCQPGSADLYRWGNVVTAGMAAGSLGNMRMNPTQTLHAVDNLALSAFAIANGNRSYCLGLGGAAGQAWCGLEAVVERADEETLLMAGDQDAAEDGAPGLGVALLFSRRAKPYQPLGRMVRLLSITRSTNRTFKVKPHAAIGLAALLQAICSGQISYVVPPEHTDGLSSVTINLEIS